MKKARLTVSILLVLITLLSASTQFWISSGALKLSYVPGSAYKGSIFYKRVTELELTGDQRYDFISIALSQIGYHEGASEADMDGLNIYGNKNFVEYNRIYGKVDNNEGNGVSYGYEWCAAFVSWCLRQAGVPSAKAITEISCNRMTNFYKNRSLFHPASSGYTPLPGDIIMFSNKGVTANHVGLVLGVKDGTVYTVEGNNGGKVDVHSFALTDSYIFGYCVPEYTTLEDADYASLMEKGLCRQGTYIVTSTSVNVRKEPSSSSELLGALKKGTSVEINVFSSDWGKIDYNGEEAWISTDEVRHKDYMVYTVSYYRLGGRNGLDNQRAMAGDTITLDDTVPVKNGSTFLGWSTNKSATTVDYKCGDQLTLNADTALYAVWEANVYTVTFYNDDGSVISQKEYKYAEELVEPETPVKPNDAKGEYVFAGWDNVIVEKVKGNMEYRATYTLAAEEPAEASSEESVESKADEDDGDDNCGNSTMTIIIVSASALVVIAIAIVLKAKASKKATN